MALLHREPVQWTTPTGDSIAVELQLRFSTFFGYSSPTEDTDDYDVGSQNYLGTQCHGVMFPAELAALPHAWPVSPPIVSGKVSQAGFNPDMLILPTLASNCNIKKGKMMLGRTTDKLRIAASSLWYLCQILV